MDYRKFTNDSLLMMYDDDAQRVALERPRFGVRRRPNEKEHAGNLEGEMLRRGISFALIDWSED
jgi:hypothetical protein